MRQVKMERDDIKAAVKEAFQEELRAFYIDRETHYKQHEFIGSMIQYCEQCKSVVLKTVLGALLAGALGLMYLGFAIKHGGK